MFVTLRSGRRDRLGALGIALVLAATFVAPALAAAGPTRLSDGIISARTGTTATSIAFTVAYRNREGSPADWVRVRIGSVTRAMTRISGDDWKRLIVYRWSGTLPAGQHDVTFQAMSRDRFSDALPAGTVTITVPPTPSPTPTPKPTPKPTATPTPRPTATPTPRPTPSPSPTSTPRATGTPTPTATPGVNPHGTPGPDSTDTPTPAPTASPSGTPSSGPGQPTDDPTATPTDGTGPDASPTGIAVIGGPNGNGGPGGNGGSGGPDGPGGPDGQGGPDVGGAGAGPDSPTDPSGNGSNGGGGGDAEGGPFGALIAVAGILGTGRPEVPIGLFTTLIATSGMVGAAMAFGVFGKRRRDGEPPAPDDVLARDAATGMHPPVGALTAAGMVAAGAVAVAPAPAPIDLEAAMPRWRRPSLMEARKADPIRNAPPVAPRLTFDHGLVGPIDGHERRLIRYTLVRLLDQPDELRGAEIGFVDQGDEVQLIEKRGVYWFVLCPDGRQGWIHKMTLGDVVGEPAASAATATMPIAADTWTMGDDVDGDVMAAFLESRRRSA